MSESVQSAWLSCGALDVISLHAYGVGDFATASLRQYVTEAQNTGKKLLMEEWGACYFTTENNNCAGLRARHRDAQRQHQGVGGPDQRCRVVVALLAGAAER